MAAGPGAGAEEGGDRRRPGDGSAPAGGWTPSVTTPASCSRWGGGGSAATPRRRGRWRRRELGRFCVVVVVVAIVVVVTSVKVAVPRGRRAVGVGGVGGAGRSFRRHLGPLEEGGEEDVRDVARLLRLAERDELPAVASNDAISARAGSLGRAPRPPLAPQPVHQVEGVVGRRALGRAGALRGPVQFIADHHARGSAISAIDGVAEGPSSIGASGAGAATIGEEERRYSDASEVHRPGVDGSSSIDDAVPSYVSSADGRKEGLWVATRARRGLRRVLRAGRFVAEPPHGRCSKVARAVAESGWHVDFLGCHEFHPQFSGVGRRGSSFVRTSFPAHNRPPASPGLGDLWRGGEPLTSNFRPNLSRRQPPRPRHFPSPAAAPRASSKSSSTLEGVVAERRRRLGGVCVPFGVGAFHQ